MYMYYIPLIFDSMTWLAALQQAQEEQGSFVHCEGLTQSSQNSREASTETQIKVQGTYPNHTVISTLSPNNHEQPKLIPSYKKGDGVSWGCRGGVEEGSLQTIGHQPLGPDCAPSYNYIHIHQKLQYLFEVASLVSRLSLYLTRMQQNRKQKNVHFKSLS